MASGAVVAAALLTSTPLAAQTIDPKATASAIASQLQGQVTGNVTSQSAPNAVPGYGGADLPQGQYLSNPNSLAGDGAVAAVTSQPYAIVTNPNRPTVDTSTLGLTSAKQVESSPTSYTGIAGSSQGNCQPIPASSGTASTYYDSCQIGTAEADSNFTCTIGWANQFTSAYQYTCHTSEWDIYNPNTGGTFYWGDVSDCGSLPASLLARRSARPRSPRLRPGRPARACGHLHRDRHDLQLQRADQLWGQRVEDLLHQPHDLVLRAAAAGSGAGRARCCLCRAIQTYQGSTVDNADCQAKLKALPTGETCLQPTQVCVDASPTTRTINGVAVTHDCWQWQATYQCSTLSSANDCATLSAKSNCSFDHEVCLDSPQTGACQVKSEVYKCTTPATTQSSQAYSCSGDVYCIDGSCTQLPTSPAPDLANALVAMNAMKDANQQFDANKLTIFDGDATGCHKPLFGLVNCCAGKVSGLLTGAAAASAAIGLASGNPAMLLGLVTQFLPLFMCSGEEMQLDVKDRMGLCHYVGEYCSEKALFVCTTMRKSYCCYQSKLARVIQEQGRAQLGLDFGSPQSPTCTGFTVDQFSKLDLSKMDFSEVFADFTSAVSLPASLQTSAQIQQKVQAYYQTHGQGS
jgi:conjugal transfer mating pair stabilization protein TraN